MTGSLMASTRLPVRYCTLSIIFFKNLTSHNLFFHHILTHSQIIMTPPTRIAVLTEHGISVMPGMVPGESVYEHVKQVFDGVPIDQRGVIINKRVDPRYWGDQLPFDVVVCVRGTVDDFRHQAFRCPSELFTGIPSKDEGGEEEDDEAPIVLLEQCGGVSGLEFNLHVAIDGKPIDVYPFVACRPEQIDQVRFRSGYFHLPEIYSYFKEYSSNTPRCIANEVKERQERKKRAGVERIRPGKRVCIESTNLKMEEDAMDVVGAFGF